MAAAEQPMASRAAPHSASTVRVAQVLASMGPPANPAAEFRYDAEIEGNVTFEEMRSAWCRLQWNNDEQLREYWRCLGAPRVDRRAWNRFHLEPSAASCLGANREIAGSQPRSQTALPATLPGTLPATPPQSQAPTEPGSQPHSQPCYQSLSQPRSHVPRHAARHTPSHAAIQAPDSLALP